MNSLSYSSRVIGKVARVNVDSGEIIINRGSNNGIKLGERFHVVRLGDEIIDPDNNQSLGQMETLVGRVQVVHVQESMATAVSLDRVPILPPSSKASPTTSSVSSLFEVIRAAASATSVHSASSVRDRDIQHAKQNLSYVSLKAAVGDIVVRV